VANAVASALRVDPTFVPLTPESLMDLALHGSKPGGGAP